MKKKLTMLLASLFLVLGTAWAQVVEGQPYFLKVINVENGYIDAKNGVSETSGQTITISSQKVPVYFKKGTTEGKWKISVKSDFSGGFLRVNKWCANPNQTEEGQTEWSLVSVEGEQGLYYLSQSYYEGDNNPDRKCLGAPSQSIGAKLYTDQVVANAVKFELVNPIAIEVTTDENDPKWYTIKNVRGDAYAYYGNKILGLSDYIGHQGFLFYFTEGETKGTYKIHNSLTDKKCGSARGDETWTTNGIDWYIQVSGNTSYPGLAISKQKELTPTGSEAWNDNGNNHTDVNWYGGNDDGSTWEITRYEGDIPTSTIQLSTNDNIVLHYIRSVRRTSYVNFDGHNSTFKEGAQGLASYWYFVEDTEAPVIDGFIACKIFNAAYATAVKDHSSGNMEDNSSTYYIGLRENERYGYIIRRSDSETNGWHDYSGTHVGDYGIGDDGSLWRIYPAGKTGAELKNEAAALKAEATVLIAAAEEADYYSYSDDAIATAKAAVNAIHTEELSSAVSGLTTIPAAMNTLKATEKGVEGPVAGQYIRLKNKYFKSYLAVNSDNEKIGKLDDRTDLATLWKVEVGSVNGSVKLKNVANEKYVGSIVQDVPVEQKDKAEASDLTFSNVAEVYAAFQTTGGNNYSFANYNSWQGGILGWGKDDASSQWIMSQAYPLTIVYKFGEDELDRVEAYVDPATEYTIENNIADKVIATCTANGQPIEPVDGDYIVTVNEATEVVVTLKAEDMLVTGSGSTGTISVTDVNDQTLTEIPAGAPWTISIEVRNPNGAAYSSQWGTPILVFGNNTDTNTFQLYLRSVNNNTQPNKLCLVLNGKDNYIENVTASGNFTATIHYDGDKTVIVETKNLTTGNTVEQTFAASNALPAVSTFSYGLPTGMNIKSLHIDRWVNQIDCPTAATQTTLEGKKRYTFTSQKFTHINNYNKLRFTLTESAAYYEQAKTHKRMSLDEFKLYDANGDEVKLEASWFTGNNSGKIFANMLDGVNNQCCSGTWGQANAEDDWFEITLPNSIDLGGAFSFSFVTENTDMNAKRFTIDLSYEEVVDIEYTLSVNAPEGEDVMVQYDGETIVNGVIKGEVKEYLFTATTIPGYVWNVVIDEENHVVTITYTEIVPEENPAAVVELVNRIGGAGIASKFKFVLDPSINQEQETFVLGSEDDKILIKGTTISAITTGLGWYLNNVAHINISWNSLNEKTVAVKENGAAYADLSDLPLPAQTKTHTSDAKYRYYLNYCTFGYSMTSWTWTRWQQEIDWMALHGINMPLQIIGLEEVWRKFLTLEENGQRKYGYTDEEAKAFVAGPAFTAWWGMNNLEGWGGTAEGTLNEITWAGAGGVQDDAWYKRQQALATQILDRQRELGMQPVLPGWSGMVPTNFKDQSGYATRENGRNWNDAFPRPLLLNVSNQNYGEIAADYYQCLEEVMGKSQYYSMDPFHEGGGSATTEDYEALYAALETASPGSQWIIQQWHWVYTNQRLSLDAVPAGRLIVLDLFSDGKPAFDSYNGYAPQDAVFCAIPNFGGRSGLMGRLQNVTDNYFSYKAKYANIKGVGAAPEAIEQTPVTYDLIYQLPWMNGEKPNVKEWVENYAIARYGKDNAVVKEAWSLLRQSVLAYGADGIEGPIEDVWAARPNLNANPASFWGKTLNNAGGTYTPARRQMLIDAVYKLIDQEDELALTTGSVYESNYMYDLVEFGSGVMADYAYDLLLGVKAAKEAAGVNFATDETYKVRRDAFLQLILDMDEFKGTNLNFRLGKWTQEARDAAKEAEQYGATTANEDWYEYNNARTLITTWTFPNNKLRDYSYRSWQGLLKDLYYPRWKHYFDNNCTDAEYGYFEWNWAHGMKHEVGQTAVSDVPLAKGEAGHTDSYTREPEDNNTVEKAVEMFGKYIIPVAMADGTHYAYRYLTNDLSNKVTIIAIGGGSIDLTKYFGALEGATVTGEFIDGQATDFANIAVKSDLTGEAYTGIITLADGTVLTFGVSLNPDYYGVYRIKREDKPVFIGYHDWNISGDKDNGGVIGYKLLDPNGGKYVATATADEFITIMPSGNGYSISVQGQYLMSPTYNAWKHLLFSENKGDAGVYIFEETNTADLFKIKSPTSGSDPINYVNSYGNAFGNDKAGKSGLSTFTIEEVESYPLTVTAAGMATLCLPFNVVLPKGVTAYDLVVSKIVEENDAQYVAYLQSIATSDKILKAGTPVIVKAEQGSYDLAITMSNENAVSSLANSLLKGNFVSQTLTQGAGVKKFIFANGTQGVGFYIMDAEGTIGANKCWMEWAMPADANVRSLVIRFADTTDIENVEVAPARPAQQGIYNLAGQRLEAPQKGINIINGKKVVIK